MTMRAFLVLLLRFFAIVRDVPEVREGFAPGVLHVHWVPRVDRVALGVWCLWLSLLVFWWAGDSGLL
jgi:hypothetical protein